MADFDDNPFADPGNINPFAVRASFLLETTLTVFLITVLTIVLLFLLPRIPRLNSRRVMSLQLTTTTRLPKKPQKSPSSLP